MSLNPFIDDFFHAILKLISQVGLVLIVLSFVNQQIA